MKRLFGSMLIFLFLVDVALAEPSLSIEVDNPQATYEVGQVIDFRILLKDVEALALFEIPIELSLSNPSAVPGTDFHFVGTAGAWRPPNESYVFQDDGFGLAVPPSDVASGSVSDFVFPPSLGGLAYSTASPHQVVAIGSIVANLPGTLTLSLGEMDLKLWSDFDIDFNTGALIDGVSIEGLDGIVASLPSQSFEIVQPMAVPEPSSGMLALIALGVLGAARMRKPRGRERRR